VALRGELLHNTVCEAIAETSHPDIVGFIIEPEYGDDGEVL